MIGYQSSCTNRRVDATMSADVENIDRFIDDAMRVLAANGLERHTFTVSLLLREGLNNAVIHGCRKDETKSVHAHLLLEDRGLSINVDDEGEGFPWRDALMRDTDDSATSGRGIEIFKKYATAFNYYDRGNRLSLQVAFAEGDVKGDRHGY